MLSDLKQIKEGQAIKMSIYGENLAAKVIKIVPKAIEIEQEATISSSQDQNNEMDDKIENDFDQKLKIEEEKHQTVEKMYFLDKDTKIKILVEEGKIFICLIKVWHE